MTPKFKELSVLDARNKKKKYNKAYYRRRKQGLNVNPDRKIPLFTRQPEWLVARLQRLAAEGMVTGKYPCKTVGEAVTWILTKGLKMMKDDPIVGDSIKYVEAKQAIEKLHTVRKEATSLLHTAQDEVAQLLAIGAEREALQYYHSALSAIRELPPTVWLDEVIKRFQQRFPELAREKKVPGLGSKVVRAGKRFTRES